MLMTDIPGAPRRAHGAKPPLYVVLPVIAANIGDHMAAIVQAGRRFWACTNCLVTPHQQCESAPGAPSRGSDATLRQQRLLYDAANSVDPARRAAALKLFPLLGLRDTITRPAVWRVGRSMGIPWWELMDYHTFVPYEILHQWLVGILKHLAREVLENGLPSDSERALNRNVRLVAASFGDGVRRYDSFDDVDSLKEISQLTGRGRESLLVFLLVAFRENVVRDDKYNKGRDAASRRADEAEWRASVLWVMETALKIVTIARGWPTREEIEWIKETMPVFMEETKRAFPRQKSGWSFPKFHSLIHLVDAILAWGSLSNVSMSFFEWLHGTVKADAKRLNQKLAMPVALVRRAGMLSAVKAAAQLRGDVGVIDTTGPVGGVLHTFSLEGAIASSPDVDALFRMASPHPLAASPLQHFKALRLNRVCNYQPVVHRDIVVGDVVRLGSKCERDTPLFSVVAFLRVGVSPAAEEWVLARVATEETINDRAAGVPPAYPSKCDTHVRVIRNSHVAFKATRVWNIVFSPPAIAVTAAAAMQHERRLAAVLPDRFTFTWSLERTRH